MENCLHLIPINQGNELDPHRAKHAESEELEVMAGRIKKEIK